MRIVSTTLTGNSASLVGDALASVVAWVDACLVVDTGITDDTIAVARSIAGDKLVVRAFAWCDDFSAARNFALDAAHGISADWTVTLDTDERIDARGVDMRAAIEASPRACLMMRDESGTYAKERCFRLPAGARFRGPTHESFPAHAVGFDVIEGACFREVPKSRAAYVAKFERDARVLAAYVGEHPGDPRWLYYLGDALANLERRAEAIAAFERCAALRGWNEESAWACYRAAEQWCALEQWTRAVDACAAGLARHAGIAELAWLAGFASWRAGEVDQAIAWSHAAIAGGLYRGRGRDVKRIGFRHPPALWEGPFDVLRFALRARGDDEGAAQAERDYGRARETRVAAS